MNDKTKSVSDVQIIMNQTIDMITSSKDQVLSIVENARKTYETQKQELVTVKEQIDRVILSVDALEIQDKLMRQKLVQVSKDFKTFNENDIKMVYEKASEIRVSHVKKISEEKVLRERRSNLEIALKSSLDNIQLAEKVVNQVTIAMNFLRGELLSVLDGLDPSSHMMLGIKVLEAQENERKRIARDIHDGPAQLMANAVMKADIVDKIMRKDFERGLLELEELKAHIRRALKEVRDIIFDLRPMTLDDLGLNPTIERLSESLKDEKFKIDLQLKTMPSTIDSSMSVAAYRVIQESLNNIKKHAKASQVRISVEYGSKYMRLIIADNGEGFDVEETMERIKSSGTSYGLFGMKERVKQLQGEFNITSEKGKGTVFTVKLPLNMEVIRE
jgi:two-component system sensor histidine kinase DegS